MNSRSILFGIPYALIILNGNKGNLMKLIILIALSLASLAVFAEGEQQVVGQQSTTPCKYANQEDRSAKPSTVESDSEKESKAQSSVRSI